MLILFLVLFFLLQALVLFCCLAAGNDPAFRVMNIKIEGITAIYDYCTLCFYFYYYSTVTLLARFLGLSTSRPLATLT